MSEVVQLKVRIPIEIKIWLASEAAINRSSQSSEVVRALRDRMYAGTSEPTIRSGTSDIAVCAKNVGADK